MAASSTVTTGDIATAAQYNNLRTDVLDSSSSHTHAGTSNTGVKVNSNNLQGTVLASTVVTSSLTTVGTIATGVWQGTDVGVAYGGTGVSTLTDGGVLLGSGSSAITAMAVLTDGQMIVGNGSTDPVAESGATLRTSIGVGTGDSPTFTALGLSSSAPDITHTDTDGGDVFIAGNNGGQYRIRNSTDTRTDLNIDGGGAFTLNGDVTIEGTTPTLTIGDAGTEDTAIVFDGNAQDFYIGLDDTADDLVIGLGSALGTTTAMSIDSDLHFGIGGATSTGNVFNIQKTDTAAARSLVVQGALTLPSGGGNGEQIRASGTIATPAESTVYTTISTVRIHEPTITLGSGSSLTNSASLYITGAATEATNDYAVWVDAGESRFDGGAIIEYTGTSADFYADADNLIIGAGSGNTGATIYSGSSSAGAIYFADGTSGNAEYRGYLNYNHSSDTFSFGTGAAAGMTLSGGVTAVLTLGNGSAVDAAIIYNGNAQDFHIGLEDAQDDLVIGTGSTLGTNPIIMMNEQLCIGFGESPAVAPRIRIYPHTTADYDDSATFLDGAASQTNTITGNQDKNFGWNFRNYTVAGDSGTRTVAEGATVYIPAAITVGSNAAVTNNYALWVDAGDVRFDSTATISGLLTMGSNINLAGAGTVYGVLEVSGNLSGSARLIGNEDATATNPTLIPDRAEEATGIGGSTTYVSTIVGGVEITRATSTGLHFGMGAAVDRSILFDGAAVDYHIGLDDSADALVIGTGSTLGSGTSMVFGSTEGRVAIGNNSDAGGQIGVAANTGIHSDWNFGDISNTTHQGLNMTIRATQTGASGSGAIRHLFQSGVRTGSDQNWTGTPSVAGVATYLFTESSSSGVVTDMRDIWVMTGAAGGATVTNKYGIYIEDQTIGSNDYGLYIAGADTYAIWVAADASKFDGNVLLDGGHLGIGDTTPTEGMAVIKDDTSTLLYLEDLGGDAGVHGQVSFRNSNGQVGSVSTSGSTTSYNTTSDYRLKENIIDLTGAMNRVKELKPKRFNFKADATETFDGFLAHEAAEVVPISVTGTKDDMDGSDPVYQGMDSSKLVPLLTAAIKELEARVTALE